MKSFVKRIAHMNEFEIRRLLDIVIARYEELFPGWEIYTLSIEKDSDPNVQIDRSIQLLENLKKHLSTQQAKATQEPPEQASNIP